MDSYFVLSKCEGEPFMEEHNKKTLSIWINESHGEFTFLDSLPYDFECFRPHSAVIIKGNVVVPSSVKIVTEYEIE